MVDLLISVVSEALLEKYSIQVNEKWIVELDSSTGGMVFQQVHDINHGCDHQSVS